MNITTDFKPSPVAVDVAHNIFITGCVLAQKPARVLELGVGSGYLTRSILDALQFNGSGALTCVDNWCDNHGKEPPLASQLRKLGAVIEVSNEEDFVRKSQTGSFDMLVSDADHCNSHKWLDQHLRIVRPDGFLFFHDTNNDHFPLLKQLEARVLHLPHYHFVKDSRPDENCNRGLLFVINRKGN